MDFILNLFQPPVPTMLDATWLAPRPSLVVAMITSRRLTVLLRKVVASIPNSAAVRTTSLPPRDRNWKVAAASTVRLAVAQTIPLRLEDPTSRAAVACTRNSRAVPTATPQPLDPTTKDADATRSNSDAALILLPWPKDPISRDADARTPPMDVVKTNELQLTDRNLKAVLANHPNTVVVSMELLQRRVPTTTDAQKSPNFPAVIIQTFNLVEIFVFHLFALFRGLRTG